jgi:hypothetical protein
VSSSTGGQVKEGLDTGEVTTPIKAKVPTDLSKREGDAVEVENERGVKRKRGEDGHEMDRFAIALYDSRLSNIAKDVDELQKADEELRRLYGVLEEQYYAQQAEILTLGQKVKELQDSLPLREGRKQEFTGEPFSFSVGSRPSAPSAMPARPTFTYGRHNPSPPVSRFASNLSGLEPASPFHTQPAIQTPYPYPSIDVPQYPKVPDPRLSQIADRVDKTPPALNDPGNDARTSNDRMVTGDDRMVTGDDRMVTGDDKMVTGDNENKGVYNSQDNASESGRSLLNGCKDGSITKEQETPSISTPGPHVDESLVVDEHDMDTRPTEGDMGTSADDVAPSMGDNMDGVEAAPGMATSTVRGDEMQVDKEDDVAGDRDLGNELGSGNEGGGVDVPAVGGDIIEEGMQGPNPDQKTVGGDENADRAEAGSEAGNEGHKVADAAAAKVRRMAEGRRKKQELAAQRKEQKRLTLNRNKGTGDSQVASFQSISERSDNQITQQEREILWGNIEKIIPSSLDGKTAFINADDSEES